MSDKMSDDYLISGFMETAGASLGFFASEPI